MSVQTNIYLCALTLLLHKIIYATGAECGAVSRQEWRATSSKPLANISLPVNLVVILHTVTKECSTADECALIVRDIQKSHINDKHFNDIGYSFLVGNDGAVYEGRGWEKEGAHTLRYNDKSLGIAFIGNFNDKLPTETALSRAKDFISCGIQKGYLTENYTLVGHRQLSATESPGDKLYEEIKTWQHWSIYNN